MKNDIDNYFLDTEFYDPKNDGFSVDFISIGLAAQNRRFYGVYNKVDDQKYKGLWLEENVIRKLPPQNERLSLEKIKEGLLGIFVPAKRVEIWARNGSYDSYIMARIFHGQLEFKEALQANHGIKKITFRDSNEILAALPETFKLPQQDEAEKHIAINDAQHEQDVFNAACRFEPVTRALRLCPQP